MTHPVQTFLSLLIFVAVLAVHARRKAPKRGRKKRVPKHLRPYDDLRLTNL